MLTSNSSHWINLETKQIKFRPIYFQDSNFLIDKQYILDLEKGIIEAKT